MDYMQQAAAFLKGVEIEAYQKPDGTAVAIAAIASKIQSLRAWGKPYDKFRLEGTLFDNTTVDRMNAQLAQAGSRYRITSEYSAHAIPAGIAYYAVSSAVCGY